MEFSSLRAEGEAIQSFFLWIATSAKASSQVTNLRSPFIVSTTAIYSAKKQIPINVYCFLLQRKFLFDNMFIFRAWVLAPARMNNFAISKKIYIFARCIVAVHLFYLLLLCHYIVKKWLTSFANRTTQNNAISRLKFYNFLKRYIRHFF